MRVLRTTPSLCRAHAVEHTAGHPSADCSRGRSYCDRRVRSLRCNPLPHNKRSSSHIARLGEVKGETVPFAVLDGNIRWLKELTSNTFAHVDWFKIEAYVKPSSVPEALTALHFLGIYGTTVAHSEGGAFSKYRVDEGDFYFYPNSPYKDFLHELVTEQEDKAYLTLQIQRAALNLAIRAICGGLHTGEPGDVKIFTRLSAKPNLEQFREPVLYCICSNCG